MLLKAEDNGASVLVEVKLSRYHHSDAKGYRKYSSYSFLTSVMDVDDWSVSRLDRAIPPGKTSDTHCTRTGGWVGLRPGKDTEAGGKILCVCHRSNPGRPVCCQTLY
jgi:hypothetical protein